MSTTNPDGFSWGHNNRTSIVTMNPKCGGLQPGDPTAIYNNGVICNGPIAGKNWQAYRGDNSLRFRYPAGEPWAEQRFDMGDAYPELWVKFVLRVPLNYKHDSSIGQKNRKLFVVYPGHYTDSGTIYWEFWGDSNNSSSKIQIIYSNENGHSTGIANGIPFLVLPDDIGKWVALVFHMKAQSSETTSDGMVELWVQKEGSPIEKVAHYDGIPIGFPSDGPFGWDGGYIMGWANGNYDEETEWLMDDIVFSTTPLLP